MTQALQVLTTQGSMYLYNNHIKDRSSFADIAATMADALGINFDTKGMSFLSEIIQN